MDLFLEHFYFFNLIIFYLYLMDKESISFHKEADNPTYLCCLDFLQIVGSIASPHTQCIKGFSRLSL